MNLNLIDKVRRKMVLIKHKYRVIDFLDHDDMNLKQLRKQIHYINGVELGTSSWEIKRKEIRRAILKENMFDFLNFDVIQRNMYFEAFKCWYLEVMKNNLLANSIKESSIGNPKPYYLDVSTSGNLITHAYHVSKLFKKCTLKDFDNVIELGGGYGSMCRLFMNMNYLGKYIIFDLPEFLALQRFYLNSINSNYTKNTVFTGDTNKIDKGYTTLLIATWSLSEMPLHLREELLECLDFNYCIIGFQAEFDGINNVEYFNQFRKKYHNINFELTPIKHLKGNFYLIGTKTT